MSFCTQCGAQINDGQAFCSACGAPVTPAQKFNAPPPPQNENNSFANENTQSFNDPLSGSAYGYSAGSSSSSSSSSFGGYGSGFSSGSRAPIQNRNIVTCVILSLVTCGIYGLYWYFCIIQDLNTVSDTKDSQTPGMILLLSIVTCGIYGFIWLYNAGDRIDAIKVKNGELASGYGLVFILLAIFGLTIVDYALIQTELNKLA